MDDPPVCPNPEACCKELSRVWQAMGSPLGGGRYLHELVAEAVSERKSATARVAQHGKVAEAAAKEFANAPQA